MGGGVPGVAGLGRGAPAGESDLGSFGPQKPWECLLAHSYHLGPYVVVEIRCWSAALCTMPNPASSQVGTVGGTTHSAYTFPGFHKAHQYVALNSLGGGLLLGRGIDGRGASGTGGDAGAVGTAGLWRGAER